MVLGIDVACRVGNAIYPDHYDRGWHITGSTGMLGAAAACARLLGLDVARTTMALGIAASQPIGVREQFGSMTKAFHPGGAARAGLMSALMARHGYTASARALEAPRGLMQTFSTKCDWREITDELGERFEIAFNTYKPFACGIVIHPCIDGCMQLRDAHRLRRRRHRARRRCACIRWCSSSPARRRRAPGSKASSASTTPARRASCSAAPAKPNSPTRSSRAPTWSRCAIAIVATADDAIDEAAADVTIDCRDGRTPARLRRARDRQPRAADDDADLARKFHGLVDGVIGRRAG